ncbi:MAG: ATP-dependent DNA helicase RecG [Spirochaetales bacterium]|nr:ATP-dependent DNA helicase RecG [Spirochaetales bacterium]
MFLRELKQPVTTVRGIGAKHAEAFGRLGISCIADLLLHLPRDYEDRKTLASLESIRGQGIANTTVRVREHIYFGFGRKKTLKIIVEDGTKQASLLCFNRNFLAQYLRQDRSYFLYGTFQYRYGELQSSAFELEPWSEEPEEFGRILPLYPLTSGLGQKMLRRAVDRALELYAEHIENELPTDIVKDHDLMDKQRALSILHRPGSGEEILKARKTLAFEELFYLQFITARAAMERRVTHREPCPPDRTLIEKLRNSLPFSLTEDQERSLEEILQDMSGPYPMARLIQGDVGVGKTLLAFMAALGYVRRGGQTAFMAPTELLARQHAENASRLLSPLGLNLAFLSGNLPSGRRDLLKAALKQGDIDILVGTHALFSNDITFNNLKLVIIDEQHRFGVHQRTALMRKGTGADLLLMTATPIPRTLAMTVLGDLDVSTLRKAPAGRKPVITHLAREGNEKKVYDAVRAELKKGRQAYFVYPLISESAKLEIKDAETMFRKIRDSLFPEYKTALIHSRIDEDKKKETMDSFNRGDIDILVATSVVEVGVDVSNATCMVIEHSERFGLSALHQLRGRVGRGSHQSYAFLIYSGNLTEDAKERLKVMKNSTDGFFIAEEDLRIRGPGNLTGLEQSGYFRFTVADITKDTSLLSQAREAAFSLAETDPGLLEPPHRVVAAVLERCPPFDQRLVSTF